MPKRRDFLKLIGGAFGGAIVSRCGAGGEMVVFNGDRTLKTSEKEYVFARDADAVAV